MGDKTLDDLDAVSLSGLHCC